VDRLFPLFQKYQQGRHSDGNMADMDITAFRDMLQDHPGNARLMLCTKDHRILGVMLFDDVADGTSAVYSFYETAEDKRSLGTWMVLKLVEYTAAQQKPYAYLGYWIAASPKMSYKARFQPLQILIKNEWTDFKTIS
jgi:arginine-tRNA-protein transferase